MVESPESLEPQSENKLHSILHHPAVEGGLAPFLVALAVAELLQRPRLSGLAIAAGFAVTVHLAIGLSLEPLTAMRKIALLGLGAAIVALPLALLNSIWVRPVVTIFGGLSALWVLEHTLLQQQPAVAVLWGAGCAVYVGWLVFWLDGLEDSPVRAGSAGVALGLGTGLAALTTGAAQLGLFGLALAAGAGAFLLIQIITNSHLAGGRSLTWPAALIAGLAGCLAVLSTRLAWYALLPLAVVPLAARIPVSDRSAIWLQSLLLLAATLVCAAAGVYLAGAFG
jgi:hypothetical protein